MIKAQELRIGNYVLDTYNKVELVRNINERGINYYRDMGCDEIDLFEKINPIPLTEEWLLQFGFEKSGRIFKKQDNWFEIEKHQAYWFSTFGEDVKLKYVHQIQNLYHSLTGSELTIK